MIRDPAAIENPFFLLGRNGCGCRWCFWPPRPRDRHQAVISGAFSMARQCMQLGFLARMTSAIPPHQEGRSTFRK